MANVTLIAGTEKGAFLFRSGGARRDWRIEGPVFKGWKVTASDRTPDGKFLLATASQVYGAALHESRDLKSFRQIERGPAYPEGSGRKFNQVWTIACGTERHYAGVDEAGLFVSEDGGASWHPVPGLNDHPTRAAWYPGNGGLCAHSVLAPRGRLYVGISAVGVWRSDDGGKTWTARNEGVLRVIEDKVHKEIGCCVHAIVADPASPDTVWRQDHAGMYRTRNGGARWEKIEKGLPSGFGFPLVRAGKTLFCVPLESDEYRVPRDGALRVYRSRDGGDSWHEASRGLPETPVYAAVLRGAMAADGLAPAGVYLGTTAGQVFASADEGDSWRALPATLPRVLHLRAYVDG